MLSIKNRFVKSRKAPISIKLLLGMKLNKLKNKGLISNTVDFKLFNLSSFNLKL